jgi:Trypsin
MIMTPLSGKHRGKYLRATTLMVGIAAALFALPGFSTVPGDVTPRIVDGVDVPNGKYPFVAMIGAYYFNDHVEADCVGTLVAPDIVVTAAHCMERYLDDPQTEKLGIAIGRPDPHDYTMGQRVRLRSLVLHPQYDPATRENNIAFIELEEPVKGIAPLALTPLSTAGQVSRPLSVTLAGWGLRPGYRMREKTVAVIDAASCQAANTQRTICAAPAAEYFDDGGPVFAQASDTASMQLVGIVSEILFEDAGLPQSHTAMDSATLWETLKDSPEGARIAGRLGR